MKHAERWAAMEMAVVVALMFIVPLRSLRPCCVNMSDDFYNTLFGAVVGGLVTLIVSVVVNGLVARQHEKDRRLGLAYSIRYKVMRIADAVIKIQRHVDDNLRGVPDNVEKWPLIQPFRGGSSERFEFTSDEIALFQMRDQSDYANEILDLASLHNLLLEVRTGYNADRQALGYMLAAKGYVEFDGNVGSVSEQARRDPEILPRHIEVSDLAETLIRFSREGSPHAEKVASEISAKLTAMLDDPRFKAGIRLDPPRERV